MPLRLDQASKGIGRQVIYRPPGGNRPEFGQITEVRNDFVFVLYTGDRIAKATHPMMLDFTS